MDHFTEKGLLAKEIKVAEIVEVHDSGGGGIGGAGGDAWDAGEESHYALYGENLLTFSRINIPLD